MAVFSPFTLLKSISYCVNVQLLITLCLFLPWQSHAQYSQVISIGDSLSDTGNTDNATFGLYISSDYFDGRYSNGQIWNELLALELELPLLEPSREGGTNYAYAGALTAADIVINILFFNITLSSAVTQIYDYLGDVANQPDADALYTVTIGGNDILDAGDGLSAVASQAEIDTAKQELRNIASTLQIPLAQILNNLASSGAAKLVLLNAPNVGVTPRAITAGKQAIFQQLSQAYNLGLQDVVTALNDPRIITVDFYTLTSQITADPASYGLSNVTEQCYDADANTICSNPNDYLFWDDIHPTTIGHTWLMLEVVDVLTQPVLNVPLPSILAWVLLICLTVLATYSTQLRSGLRRKKQ